jgi:hypothetical protein
MSRPISLLSLIRKDAPDEVILLAIALGADVNECDVPGFTPLLESIRRDRPRVATMLLAHKCYFYHETMYFMIDRGDAFACAVQELLHRGFMLSFRVADMDPMQYARKKGTAHILKVLMDHCITSMLAVD